MAEEIEEKKTAPEAEAPKAKAEKAVKKTTTKKTTVKEEVKVEEKSEKPVKKAVKKEEVKEEAAVKALPKKAKTTKAVPHAKISTGRRKDAIARVRLVKGSGKIIINGRDMDSYLPLETLKLIVRQPLVLTDTADKFDVLCNVHGGGYTGQTGAIRHGIARALVKENETYKAELKKAGFLSRDSRMKERKKYGLKKARKAPQFSKR